MIAQQRAQLIREPVDEFENLLMSLDQYEYLLNEISPVISKQDTHMRMAILARVRLAITFRYWAIDESTLFFQSICRSCIQSNYSRGLCNSDRSSQGSYKRKYFLIILKKQENIFTRLIIVLK